MKRCFLTILLILICLFLVVYKCFAWPTLTVYISDSTKYTEVGNSVSITADVVDGGPIDTWDWWPSGIIDSYSEGPYNSTASVSSDTSGTYTVYAEGTDYYSQSDMDSATVYIVAVTDVISSTDTAVVGEDVTFGAITDPLNMASHEDVDVTFIGGGDPEAGSGSQFTTNWSTGGTKTVTVFCGSSSVEKSVDIVSVSDVTFTPDTLIADGAATSTASATIEPSGRTITWSIEGNALGCTINSSTGVITAGTTGGIITVRATDSVLSSCYSEATIDVVAVHSVTFSPDTLIADGAATSTASATIEPSGRTITWSIEGNALGCTINSSTGVITAGTTGGTITVRAADSVLSNCYAEATIDITEVVTVDTVVEAGTTDAGPLLKAVGDSFTLEAKPLPPDASCPSGGVDWSMDSYPTGGSWTLPSNSPTFIVPVQITYPGNYTIRGKCGSSDTGDSIDIVVVEVSNVTFSPDTLIANGAATSTASATIEPSGRTITWSIEGNALGCTINSSTGVITAGTTGGIITVRAADSASPSCYAEEDIEIVNITVQVTSCPDLLAMGSTSTASATIAPSDRTITWSIVGEALGCTIDSSTGEITTGTPETSVGGLVYIKAADSEFPDIYNIDCFVLFGVGVTTPPKSNPAYVALGEQLQLDCELLWFNDPEYTIFNWEKVSGPGNVTFSDTGIKNPTFSANQTGDYTVKVSNKVLDVTASDSTGTIAFVEVDTVVADGPGNDPKYVLPGTDVYLVAVKKPYWASWPDGKPTWSFTQPTGANATLTIVSQGSTDAAMLSGLTVLGDYVVTAECGSSDPGDNSVTITVIDLQITDPDGNPAFDHQFAFDSASPGVCNVTATGTTGLPALDADLGWTLDDISGSTKTSNPSPANGPTITFTYTTLPSSNSEFGQKTLTLTHLPSGLQVTKIVEIFFEPEATNHTGEGAGTTPNWYYYWKQGPVSTLSSFKYGTSGAGYMGQYFPDTDELYVYDAAAEGLTEEEDTFTNRFYGAKIRTDETGWMSTNRLDIDSMDVQILPVWNEEHQQWVRHKPNSVAITAGNNGVIDTPAISPNMIEDIPGEGQVLHTGWRGRLNSSTTPVGDDEWKMYEYNGQTEHILGGSGQPWAIAVEPGSDGYLDTVPGSTDIRVAVHFRGAKAW